VGFSIDVSVSTLFPVGYRLLVAVLAVCCEPVSRANSLLTGKITGNTVVFDPFTKPAKAITL
jgi:hypothetical protein